MSISEVLELPNVPFGDRDQLPSSAGVYFVTDGNGALLYIGRSVDIHFRWQNHHKLPGIDFEASNTRIHWILIAEIQDIPGVEIRLIYRFKPPLNFQHAGGTRQQRAKDTKERVPKTRPTTKEDIQAIPKVQSWIAGESEPLPRIIKEFTYNRHSGCCCFCGEPYPLKNILTAPSFDESERGVRDAFGRYLICRYCRPLVRYRTDYKTFEEQKTMVVDAAIERVERAFAILARFGHVSHELEHFLDDRSHIKLNFDIERANGDNKSSQINALPASSQNSQ